MLIRARHFATGQSIDVRHERGAVAALGESGSAPADRVAGWVAPALFDVQINGCRQIDFSSATLTAEQVRQVVDECRRHGIGGFLPTLITNSDAALTHGFSTLRQACDNDRVVRTAVPGFHLEGPYISPDDGPRGAHPLQHVRAPDFDEFQRWQDSAGGAIVLVTLAPERPGALRFIEQATRAGVVVALGHTAASPTVIRAAIAAGARLSTHLGNGSHAMLPRHENYIWEQLAADELAASFIPDGHHLPAALVKTIVRAKSIARCIITCDASSLAGLPPGRYGEWEVQAGGRVGVPGTPFLAGSGVFTDTCVGKAIAMAGISLAEALAMAGNNARALLHLPRWEFGVGSSAPLVLFDWQPGSELVVRGVVGND